MLKIVFQENLITRYKYFFPKHRKNKSVRFAEQYKPRPIRGSNEHCNRGVRGIHWELPTLFQ